MALVREQRQRSVESLSNLRDAPSTPAKVRIQAIRALKLLDVAPSEDQLVQLAKTNTEATLPSSSSCGSPMGCIPTTSRCRTGSRRLSSLALAAQNPGFALRRPTWRPGAAFGRPPNRSPGCFSSRASRSSHCSNPRPGCVRRRKSSANSNRNSKAATCWPAMAHSEP